MQTIAFILVFKCLAAWVWLKILYLQSIKTNLTMKKYYFLVFLLFQLNGFVRAANILEAAPEPTFNALVVVPTFSPIGPICSGSTAPVLPAVSNNGITGTWSPAVINTSATTTYTFTPDAGQDAVPATMIVQVIQAPLLISSASSVTVCVGTFLSPVTYSTGNSGAAIAISAGNLPAGVMATFNAVTGIMTISGTPAEPGTFIYEVTATNGGCVSTVTGSIMVNPNVGIALFSGAATANQVLCFGGPIVPIVYGASNGATGISAVGLPFGVTANYLLGNITLVGTPASPGTFNYTVTTVGGCSQASLSGTITVNTIAEANLECDNVNSTSSAMAFDWSNVPGATAYFYSYSINNGPLVSGTIAAPSGFSVPGVSVGQSVTFTIAGVEGNIPCFSPQSVTCVLAPLKNREFENDAFAFYPNPVTEMLHLDYNQPFLSIQIFNTLGQEIQNHRVNTDRAVLNMSDLRQGIYFVKAATANVSRTFPVVKR